MWYREVNYLELVCGLIHTADESTSMLVNCQQHGGLLSEHADLLQICNALELIYSGQKTYDIRWPTIFSWTPEWSEVVNEYNSKLTSDPTCQDHHGYSTKSRKPALLMLDVPPRLSTCSPYAPTGVGVI